jgi:hypothetical protein
MIDFMNLKIKPTQTFGDAHKGKIYVRVFIVVSDRTYINICVCFLKNKKKKGSRSGQAGVAVQQISESQLIADAEHLNSALSLPGSLLLFCCRNTHGLIGTAASS